MSTIMNLILEGNLKQTVLYTYSTIMNFILEGKLCFTETKRLCRITLISFWRPNIYLGPNVFLKIFFDICEGSREDFEGMKEDLSGRLDCFTWTWWTTPCSSSCCPPRYEILVTAQRPNSSFPLRINWYWDLASVLSIFKKIVVKCGGFQLETYIYCFVSWLMMIFKKSYLKFLFD